MGREQADPFGLKIAAAAQANDPDATVILFGSRARGDHRPDSDVDLLVVWDDTLPRPAPRGKAEAEVQACSCACCRGGCGRREGFTWMDRMNGIGEAIRDH